MDEGTLFNPETGELRAGDECANCALATKERLQAERDLHAAELELRKVRRLNKSLTTELRNQQHKAQEYGVAEALGRYWILRCAKDPKRTVLGDKRLKKVMARLQDGYTPFYIARAIDGLAEFFWTNENTGERHNDLELVCRDETKIEKYHTLAEANQTATRIDRVWFKEWGISDQFADVREHLNDLAEIGRDTSGGQPSGKEDSDMAEYDDTNRGVLFKNDRKEKESQPDYRGEVNVNGDEFELAAWIRKSQKGVAYMSLSVKPKGEFERQQAGGAQASQPQTATSSAPQTTTAPVPDDDDIPF